MAYAFVDYHTASVALLQACQALAVAAGRIPHGQALFASCFLHDSSGEPVLITTILCSHHDCLLLSQPFPRDLSQVWPLT